MNDKPMIPLVLKLADWPLQDQGLWKRCNEKGKLFDVGDGAFAGWSDGSRRFHAQQYGSWLSYVARRRPDLVGSHPAARVTRETVEAFIEEGRERLKLRTIANQLLSLATTIRGFAPEQDFGWLFKAADKLLAQSDNRQLKPPLPVSAHDLFAWSLDRLRSLGSEAQPDRWWTATEFRQALMVGLLISCPVRVRALVAMTVSGHVQIESEYVTLAFRPQDMKDRKARRIPVSGVLVPFLLDYLNVYRPLLLDGGTSDAIWISRRGAALSQDSFTSGLALLTKRHFGIALRPHAFRHIAATSIATSDPAQSGIIRDVLGHSTIRMSEAHYNRATAQDASKRLQQVLRKRRARHRRGRRSRMPADDEA